jgi:hypothetical protein
VHATPELQLSEEAFPSTIAPAPEDEAPEPTGGEPTEAELEALGEAVLAEAAVAVPTDSERPDVGDEPAVERSADDAE